MILGRKSASTGVFEKDRLRDRKRPPRLAGMIVFTLTGFIFAIIALAAATVVPEVTRAPGEIVPADNFRQIEAPEGGQVVQVLAREGDSVEAGEALAQIASVALRRERERVEQELLIANSWIANHRYILAGLNSPGAITTSGPELEFAASVLTAFRTQQQADKEAIRRLSGIQDMQSSARLQSAERLPEKQEVAANQRSLFDRGLATRQTMIDARDEVANSEDELRALDLRIAERNREIAALQAKLVQDELALREVHTQALFDRTQQRETLLVDRTTLDERFAALVIRAPDAGVIQSVAYPNEGEVIEAGETLFELLPESESLVAVVRLASRDIGHVETEMPVQIQLETFDKRRFDPLSGEIRSISPNRVVDEATGEDYFRAVVELASPILTSSAGNRRVAAGMKVTSEIVTRERSLLAYIMKPLERSFEVAFSER